MKKFAVAIVALALLGGAAYYFIAPGPPPPETRAGATAAAAATVVAAEGKVEAMPGYDINVSTGELNGKLGKILVKEGETVRAGQIVAILQNEEHQAAVRRAEADVTVARSRLAEVQAGARTEEIREAAAAWEGAKAALQEAAAQLKRHRDLLARGMVSPAAVDERQRVYDTARAAAEQAEQRTRLLRAGPRAETLKVYADQVRLAEATLDHARQLLDKTFIRSPIAGTVIQRFLDEGEGVTPEIPILDVADLEKIWLNIEVDETDIGKLSLGDPVEITSDAYRGNTFKGRVKQIADYVGVRKIRPSNPAVNLGLKVVQVKVELLERTPLRLGMTVDVKIKVRSNRALKKPD